MVEETSIFDDLDRMFRRSVAASSIRTPTVTRDTSPRQTREQIIAGISRVRSEEKKGIKERRILRTAKEGIEKERRQLFVKRAKKVGSILLSTGPSLKRRGFKNVGPLAVNPANPFGKQSNPFAQPTKNPFLED